MITQTERQVQWHGEEKEDIMDGIRKCLLRMLFQRLEILAEYEPCKVIQNVYLDVMYDIQEEWMQRNGQGSL